MPKITAKVSGDVVATSVTQEASVVFSEKEKMNAGAEDQYEKRNPHESWFKKLSKEKASNLSQLETIKIDGYLEQLEFLKEIQQKIKKIVDKKWPLSLPQRAKELWCEKNISSRMSLFCQQYQTLEKEIAKNPLEKIHKKTCEELKEKAALLLNDIGEVRNDSMRAAIHFSIQPVKEGIKVHGLLLALREKKIDKFKSFVEEFKAEQLRKSLPRIMPPEKWILDKLSGVMLAGLKEAGLLQAVSTEEYWKIQKDVETLADINAAIKNVEQELSSKCSFEKWKEHLVEQCSLSNYEDSDLRNAYELWGDIKIGAQAKLFLKKYDLNAKKSLLEKATYKNSFYYYSIREQEDLIADLIFLPGMCQYDHANEIAYQGIIQKMQNGYMELFELLGAVDKKDRLGMSREENQGFVERNGKYYRFSEDVLREFTEVLSS